MIQRPATPAEARRDTPPLAEILTLSGTGPASLLEALIDRMERAR
ncbi:MAG: hypothetical protein WAT09_18860 [Paracoccaceae bacterium]